MSLRSHEEENATLITMLTVRVLLVVAALAAYYAVWAFGVTGCAKLKEGYATRGALYMGLSLFFVFVILVAIKYSRTLG